MQPPTTVLQTLFRHVRQFWLLVILLGACYCAAQNSGGSAATAPSNGSFPHEIHAAYLLAGQPIGSYKEKAEITGSGEILTTIDSDLIFNRLGSKLEMKASTQYRESSDGHLKIASGELSSSQQSTRVEATVTAHSLQIKTTTGGKSYERSVPLTGTLLGPAGARGLVLSRCHVPGDTVSYDAFFPELGSVVTITDVLVGSEDVTTDQGKIAGLKLEQTMSAMPGKVMLWLDREGWLLRQIVPGPFGDIEAIRSNAASNSQTVGAALPEEAFTQSIVKANVRLPEERLVDSVRLKVIQKQPEFGWPNLETENQQVLEKTANYVVLEVNRLQPTATQTLPLAADAALAPYLSANALLQSDDANIQAIAKSVVGNERDAWKAALALQLWTNEHMQFDPGIAIAPASEVARNRRGTCFGYAMLLGSLTRAAGIPSRLRMGYVYAGGIWGGHAWIDVRIGDRWIPLDGALYTQGAADAARFSFFTSGLEEGTLAGVGSLGQLLGHADIKLLQYTVGGKRVDVPQDAAPFVIEKDTYRNPWIGLSITKPSSFQFAESDLAWPQTTVIAMTGPLGQKMEVANLSASMPTPEFDAEKHLRSEGISGARSTVRIAGKDAVAVSSAQKAGAILIDQGNVWMFAASGPDAGKLLNRVLSSVTIRSE
jgi:hypothetical protein